MTFTKLIPLVLMMLVYSLIVKAIYPDIEHSKNANGVRTVMACAGTVGGMAGGDDFDGDGFCNSVDLDDDNDGILDTEECNSTAVFSNGGGFYYVDNSTATISQNINNVNPYGIGNTLIVNNLFARDAIPTSSSDYLIVTLRYAGITYATFQTQNGVQSSNMPITYSNGASGNLSILPYTEHLASGQPWEVYFPANIPNSGQLEIIINMEDKDGNASDAVDDVNISSISISTCQDSDGDNLPDVFDTDSDNDGCPDAIEGDGTYASSDLTNNMITAVVDADGVPNNGGNQGVGASIDANTVACCDAATSAYPDSDGDNLADNCDLDDDNDGILDTDENNCTPVNLALSSTISQSSTLATYPGPNAIDANLTNFSHTEDSDPNEWISIDLGASHFIKNIVLTNRTNCCQERLSNAYLMLSSNPFPSSATDISASLSNAGFSHQFGLTAGMASFDIPVSAEGRYIHIQKSGINIGGNALNLAEIQAFEECDADNDGIPNRLDPDSDNDGCPDAIEGDGSYVRSDLASNKITAPVDADGVPNNGGNQGIGSSQDANTVVCCDDTSLGYGDNDGDNLTDLCDLDDDNDGILDTDENNCTPVNLALSSTISQSSTLATYPGSNAIDANLTNFSHTEDTNPNEWISIDLGASHFIKNIVLTNRTDCCQQRLSNAYLMLSSNPFPTSATDVSASLSNADFSHQFGLITGMASFDIPVNAEGRYIHIQKSGTNIGGNALNLAEIQVFEQCDADNDGIPNHLDPDSDNDGCLDAIEGDGSYALSDLTNNMITAAVDADGVPNNGGNQGVGASQDANTVVCCDAATSGYADNDGDNVTDNCDLDDDNDGILDTDENSCTPVNLASSSTISQSSTLAGYPASNATDANLTNFSHTEDSDPNEWISIDLGASHLIKNIVVWNRASNQDRLSNAYLMLSSNPFPNSATDISGSLSNADFSHQFGLTTGMASFDIPVNTEGRYIHIQKSGTNIGGNALNLAEIQVFEECDADNDGIPNHLDPDSDNDGCLDAIEGDGSYALSDLTNNMITAAVDADGVPNNGGNQGVGASQDANTVVCCDAATSGYADNDGDNVTDNCDLDDDNDGILDTDENSCTPVNLASSSTISQSSTLAGYPASNATDANLTNFSHTEDSDPNEWISIDLGASHLIKNIVVWNRVSNQDRLSNAYLMLSSNPFPNSATDISGSLSNADFSHQFGLTTGMASFDIPVNTEGRYIHIQKSGTNIGGNALNLAEIQVFEECDADNDGIPNRLDPDSDNDGCPDAIEGDGSYVLSDLINNMITAAVDADGVPNNGGSQGLGSSQDANMVVCCDPTVSGNLDTDGDNITDFCDLDDDNDGILDTDECNGFSTTTIEDFNTPVVAVPSGYDNFATAFPFGASQLSNSNGTVGYLTGANPTINGITFLSPYEGSGYTGFHSNGIAPQEVVRIDLDSGKWILENGSYDLSMFLYQMNLGPSAPFNSPGYMDVFGIQTGSFPTLDGSTQQSSATIGALPGIDLLGSSTLIQNTTTWEELTFSFQSSFTYDRLLLVVRSVDGLGGSDAFLGLDYITYSGCLDQDTDSDGIADHLDLDSDNDGCPDAIEGGASFTTTDIDANDQLTGGVDANGIPTVASSGQSIGSSQDASISVCCDASESGYADNDGDNVADNCDLDDDNDGILDTDENSCTSVNLALSSTVSQSSTLATYPASNATDANLTNFSHTESNDPHEWISIDLGASHFIKNIVVWNRASNQDRLSNAYLMLSSNPFPTSVTDVSASLSNAGFSHQFGLTTGMASFDIPVNAEGRYIHIQKSGINIGGNALNLAEIQAFEECDADNDGIPNRLDPDSDNDGCPDAIEGDGTYVRSDLASNKITAPVDADGVPNNGGNQGIGSSQDANTVVCCDDTSLGYGDNDGDNLTDLCDLDDDNDGILDTDENNCTPVNLALSSTISQSSTLATYPGSNAIDANLTNFSHTEDTNPNEWISIDLGASHFIKNIVLTNRTDCCQQRLSNAYLMLSSNPFPTSATDVSASLSNADFSHQFGLITGMASFDIPVNAEGRYIHIQKSGTNIGGNALNLAEIQAFEECDADNDGIPNRLDPDSDNDGCADALEGGASFTFTDIDGSSMLIGTVDANGIPTVATATGQTVGSSQDALNLGICGPEICDDGIDNDLDGLIDCLDPECTCSCLRAPTISKQ